jgi:hypothetical protein
MSFTIGAGNLNVVPQREIVGDPGRFEFARMEENYHLVEKYNPQQLDQAINHYGMLARQAPIESPESNQIHATMAALNTVKSALLTGCKYEQYLPGNDRVLYGIKVLGVTLSGEEPESVGARKLETLMRGLGDLRPGLRPVVERLLVENRVESLDKVIGALQVIGSNLNPQTPIAAALQGRIGLVGQLRNVAAQYVSSNPNATIEGLDQVLRRQEAVLQPQVQQLNNFVQQNPLPFSYSQQG